MNKSEPGQQARRLQLKFNDNCIVRILELQLMSSKHQLLSQLFHDYRKQGKYSYLHISYIFAQPKMTSSTCVVTPIDSLTIDLLTEMTRRSCSF